MINYQKVFSKFPCLETKNLKLREFTEKDVTTYFEMCQDPDYMQEFLSDGMWLSPTDAYNTITIKYPSSFKDQKDLTFAIVLKGKVEQIIGLRDIFIDGPNEPVVTQGFIIRDYRNQGFNQEVLNAVIQFLRNVGAKHLVFNCNRTNIPVLHIAEKLNFRDITPSPLRMFGYRKQYSLNL